MDAIATTQPIAKPALPKQAVAQTTPAQKKITPCISLAAGAVESVTVVTSTERIKTALIDDARSGNKRLNGGFHALRTIAVERGVREIYRGLMSTTLKQSATSGVRMGSYNILKDTFKSDGKNPFMTFGIGAIAGVITVYATQPFDTIKTRSQSAKGIGMGEAVQQVLRESVLEWKYHAVGTADS
ncbi:CTP1-Mitochondrial citrate transporter-member of the mitochondrial carrier (MCF) family [Fusarium agapanthi]|uniref:CTP1-Mitochondrial citrate transporter-member of the mitochondrial carrier (MCF) family n=1 Tax=Fusarium agapanthi TaxID=1803897 RepID=A0A9P5BQX5_9HYPO|nr:CTP1-Mitochondrial citrate transporter-member of the mitochondrial carrier (MCF) family [Fusarium agapanthi]